MDTITLGDTVRSYDFPGLRDDCFVEGQVTAVRSDTYEIRVSRQVVQGREHCNLVGMNVYPPLNGLQGLFGVANGVVKV